MATRGFEQPQTPGKGGGITESAKEAAGRVAGKVGEQTRNRADQQRETAASGLADVAGAVRRMGEELRERDQGTVVRYAANYGDALAQRIDRASEYLRNHDVRQIVDEVESFARRKPEWFLGGAFLIGLAATRFLRSRPPSSERQPRTEGYSTGAPVVSAQPPATNVWDVPGSTPGI